MALEAFERKIVKQVLLEWWLAKKPFDRVFSEVLREHRVGATQRVTIAFTAYNYVRYLGLLFPRPINLESPQWQRDFEASLELAADPHANLAARHEQARPRFSTEPLKHLAQVHAVPDFLMPEFAAAPVGWHDYLHASLREAPLFVRLNSAKMTKADFLKRFAAHGIEERWLPGSFRFPKRWAINQDEAFLKGAFEIQDEHSQLVAWVAAPKPGERVLDMCAGAGGKTLHMADFLQGQGEIVAYDLDKRKLSELQQRTKRAGVMNARVSESLPGKDERFDLVVVDAPCSGLGTLRRNPDRLFTIKESELKSLARVQVELTERAITYLKPGGRLVYATCTVRPHENEFIIRRLVEKHGRKLASVSKALEKSLAPKVTMPVLANFLADAAKTPAARIAEGAAFGESQRAVLHLSPSSQGSGACQGDGFFVALLN